MCVGLCSFRKLCGELEYYDKSYDRITTKLEKRLARVNRLFHKVTTTDDPIIRKVRACDQEWIEAVFALSLYKY